MISAEFHRSKNTMSRYNEKVNLDFRDISIPSRETASIPKAVLAECLDDFDDIPIACPVAITVPSKPAPFDLSRPPLSSGGSRKSSPKFPSHSPTKEGLAFARPMPEPPRRSPTKESRASGRPRTSFDFPKGNGLPNGYSLDLPEPPTSSRSSQKKAYLPEYSREENISSREAEEFPLRKMKAGINQGQDDEMPVFGRCNTWQPRSSCTHKIVKGPSIRPSSLSKAAGLKMKEQLPERVNAEKTFVEKTKDEVTETPEELFGRSVTWHPRIEEIVKSRDEKSSRDSLRNVPKQMKSQDFQLQYEFDVSSDKKGKKVSTFGSWGRQKGEKAKKVLLEPSQVDKAPVPVPLQKPKKTMEKKVSFTEATM